MSRDYKPTQQKSSNRKGSPFFSGFLVGLLFGVGISVALTLYIKGIRSPLTAKVEPAINIEPAKKDSKTDKSSTNSTSENGDPDHSRFDFYTILPGTESKVTEQEIKDQSNLDKPKESYFLQIGAFQTEQEADNMKAKLALLGMESIIQTATIPDKGVWHRVRVGPLTDINQINKTREELTSNGFKSDLIKVNITPVDQSSQPN